MDTETALIQPVMPSAVQITPVGFDFREALTEETAVQVGGVLKQFTRAVPWLWGDFLNRAALDLSVSRGPASPAWTDAKVQLLAGASHLEPGTLNTYRWVCRHYNLSTRIEKLSFAHHREALCAYSDGRHNGSVSEEAMAQVQRVLTMAVANNWSVADMREFIRKEKGAAMGMDKHEPIDKTLSFVGQVIRGFKGMVAKQPVQQWSREKRDLWKQALQPVVDFASEL